MNQHSKTGRTRTWWILTRALGLLAIGGARLWYVESTRQTEPEPIVLSEETIGEATSRLAEEVPFSLVTLKQLRQAHNTQLVKQLPSPQKGPDGLESDWDGQWLNFESDGRLLFGCLRLPGGHGPHPTVVYCHGGFALGRSDIEGIGRLVEQGFAVFVPAWRGENGNTGSFELYHGEVDDAVAAMEFVAQLPHVDENAICLAGHSAGATIALLAAELSERPQAVMACGPTLDMTRLVEIVGGDFFEEAPFAIRDTQETNVRSPGRFLNNLNCPAQLVYGDKEVLLIAQAESFEKQLLHEQLNVEIQVKADCDHFTVLPEAIESAATFFSEQLVTKRETAPVTKASFYDQCKDRIFNDAPISLPTDNQRAVSIIKHWNSKPDPGQLRTDWSGFARWYNKDPYKLPRKPTFRIYPGNGHWMTSASFENDFVIASLDGSSQHVLKGTLPDIPDRANYNHFKPAGVSLDGKQFAVLWSGQKSASNPVRSLISFHESSDGRLLHVARDIHSCQFLEGGRAALFRRHSVDPKVKSGQSVSVIMMDSGTVSETIDLRLNDRFSFTPGGENLVVLRVMGKKTAMVVYSTKSAQLVSSGTYENAPLGLNVAISNDGREAFTVSKRRATVWDLETGQVAFSCRVSEIHQVASWLENRKFLVLDQYKVIDRETGRRVATMAHRVQTPNVYPQYGPWLATQTIRPGQNPVRRLPLESFQRLLKSRPVGVRPINLAIGLQRLGERRLLPSINRHNGTEVTTQEVYSNRLELNPQIQGILDYGVYHRIGATHEKDAEQQSKVVLEYSSYTTSASATTHRQLHGKAIPDDIPAAGIMNSPESKIVLNLTGRLVPPDSAKQPFPRSSKHRSPFIAEHFEIVNADSEFDESVPFDVGLPWREQAETTAIIAALKKIKFPPVNEFFLAPAPDTWKNIIVAKPKTKAIEPKVTTARFSLESPSLMDAGQSPIAKCVLHEVIKDDEAAIGALTFVRRDDDFVLLAGLHGPRVREYTLDGDSRDIATAWASAQVAKFQRDMQGRRWLASTRSGLIVIGDDASAGQPVIASCEAVDLRNSFLTADGRFIVVPASKYARIKQFTAWDIDPLLEARRSELPAPDVLVDCPSARAYLPIPGSPDMIGIEDRAIHRISVANGSVAWRSEFEDKSQSTLSGEVLSNGQTALIQCHAGIDLVGVEVDLQSGSLTNRPLARRKQKQRVYSPDSTIFATQIMKDQVAIYNAKTESQIWSAQVGSINGIPAKVINLECLVWSPDGRYLAVACSDSKQGTKLSAIDVWDVSEVKVE